jgi:phage repressor protein C with HTH and peptisase S24 domain
MNNENQEEVFFRAALGELLAKRGHGGQKRLAAESGVSSSYINDIVRGRRAGARKSLSALAQALGFSYEQMCERGRRVLGAPARPSALTLSDEEFQAVPKVKAKLSGGGGSFETDSEVVGYYAFRTDFLRRKGAPKDMVLFEVAGNSMSPVLEHGDTVLVDQSQNKIISGNIYAIGVDEAVIVKRVEAQPGVLILKSENPTTGSFEVPVTEQTNFRVIGRVVWSAREY